MLSECRAGPPPSQTYACLEPATQTVDIAGFTASNELRHLFNRSHSYWNSGCAQLCTLKLSL